MEFKTRRDFLKNTAKVSAGVAALSTLNPLMGAFAEGEAAPACGIEAGRLIEVEHSLGHKKSVGYRYFQYTCSGTTCSHQITFAIRESDLTVWDLDVQEACTGTSDGFAALCQGLTVDDCVNRMKGIPCHASPDSSCPDQSAQALAHAKMMILGETGCDCGAVAAPAAE